MARESLVNKMVYITDEDSMYCGSWGVVALYDGEYFHVKDLNGSSTPIFTRDQFKVKRGA